MKKTVIEIKAEVTPEIIADAMRKNAACDIICGAICGAVKATMTKRKQRIGKIRADLQSIRFTDLDTKARHMCLTPRVCQLAMVRFDQDVPPEPFSVRLRFYQFNLT